MKVAFLDRDGTLIEEKNYLSNVEDIKFLDNTFVGSPNFDMDISHAKDLVIRGDTTNSNIEK